MYFQYFGQYTEESGRERFALWDGPSAAAPVVPPLFGSRPLHLRQRCGPPRGACLIRNCSADLPHLVSSSRPRAGATAPLSLRRPGCAADAAAIPTTAERFYLSLDLLSISQ
ncbi:hypothetical protein CEXT_540071 [Caerostris extrusa]|uniref:Uncharacterized protein n=1 Tax=Caerostris extrusa TaxID=172846 RepID=A0AAV4T6H4_CAEEX|nr:hypothetical protein CEXT_540071 [Caerostris extrusa]